MTRTKKCMHFYTKTEWENDTLDVEESKTMCNESNSVREEKTCGRVGICKGMRSCLCLILRALSEKS